MGHVARHWVLGRAERRDTALGLREAPGTAAEEEEGGLAGEARVPTALGRAGLQAPQLAPQRPALDRAVPSCGGSHGDNVLLMRGHLLRANEASLASSPRAPLCCAYSSRCHGDLQDLHCVESSNFLEYSYWWGQLSLGKQKGCKKLPGSRS